MALVAKKVAPDVALRYAALVTQIDTTWAILQS